MLLQYLCYLHIIVVLNVSHNSYFVCPLRHKSGGAEDFTGKGIVNNRVTFPCSIHTANIY